ncbi:SMP-30/gluconolactonase/LRE family protein [Microbulbifer yueqingensis]|uniref:Gluconolactonase n=1 Tax=Microbulbifer yueqingensis TaxID=658219 RepID=A0A1G8UBA3_9GAMM|nr:SMP-30/gluconolactonase/LRE family protein [Microbulbifer yueqingensis]SDJ51021.1 gluconolactonase [Microbulbifer yueqingensis]
MRTLKLFLPSLFTILASGGLAAKTASPLPDNLLLERLDYGYGLTEGPLWHQGYLYFCDVGGGTAYRWQPSGPTQVVVRPSGDCSSLALSAGQQLVMAQQKARRVAHLKGDGTQEVLASHYQGKRLNRPNDLVVHEDGSIYFTDPALGLSEDKQQLDFTGIYRITGPGQLELLDSTVSQPNGIAFSPDYRTLYVTNSFDREVLAFDVDGHRLSNKRVFARISADTGAADGLLTDSKGNLFVAGPGGVWVFSAHGDLLDKIRIPGLQTTNVAWAGSGEQDLMITAMDSVYRIQWQPVPAKTKSLDYHKILNSYAGRYRLVSGGRLDVIQEGTQLYLREAGKEIELLPEPGNLFHSRELDIKLEFERHPNGETTGLLLHQDGFKIPAKKFPANHNPG